jgi:hypothetical protein
MGTPREDYIRALYDLSKGDPARWATFVEAFKAYTASELESMTKSLPENAAMAIGYGRKMKEQRDEFVEIETIMAKIRK